VASEPFPPEPASVPAARRFLRAFLYSADRADLFDAAELALSEIATNSVLHAHTPFHVSAGLRDDGSLRVEVLDRNSQLPAQRQYTETATTGRGMGLVSALADDCGVDPLKDGGKIVWFVVRGGVAADTDADALLAAWDIDLDIEDADDPARSEVVLLALPPTLWLAAREHHDALLRELALHAASHPDQAPPAHRFAQADLARGLISTRVLASLGQAQADAQAHRTLPPGHPSPLPYAPTHLDVRIDVEPDVAGAFAALQDLLDTAERLAANDRLLARPGLPEVAAVRDWACEQAIAQLSGVAPAPFHGAHDERFTARDAYPGGAPAVDWDASEIAASSRGAVAADDANRIIAISRPLAKALGWDADDLVGRRIVALIPASLREAHVAGFTRHLTTGQAHALGVPLRLPVLRADGTTVECDFLVEQAAAPAGRRVYVAWIEPLTAGRNAQDDRTL